LRREKPRPQDRGFVRLYVRQPGAQHPRSRGGAGARAAAAGRALAMPVMTYRQALNDTLGEELARDPNVLLMGEEIGKFQGSYRITEGLQAEFGKKRGVDTPI